MMLVAPLFVLLLALWLVRHRRAEDERAAAQERERFARIIDEQAALHRAIADKLIPRFAPPEGRPL